MEIVHGEEYFDPEDNEKGVAIGLKVPSSVKTPVGYLDSLRKYKDIYDDIYKQIEVCNKLYKYNGIIGNAVDVMVDFAVTDVRPEPTGNKQLDDLLNYWFENINQGNTSIVTGMYPLMQEIGLEWFTSGNAFPYKRWENVDVEGQVYKLPSNVYLINPEAITIPDLPLAFGQAVICLRPATTLMHRLAGDGRSDSEISLIKGAVPRSIINSIKEGRSLDGVPLNPKYVTHLKRKSKSYQPWGTPYLARCFACVSLLERLRELDESITAGLLNLVTIFKVGTKEHPASQSRVNKFASLIRNTKATTTLVWAHDVDVQQVGPDGKLLGFREKYKDAKDEVLIALGVPPILMAQSQSGDSYVAILSLIEKLTNWRQTVSIWLEQTCKEIATHNELEYSGKIKVKWDRMNLRNDAEVKNLILAFYDRGLLSINTALKEADYDLENEKAAKKREKDIKEDFLPPQLPFSGGKEVEKGKPTDNKFGNKTNKTQTKTEQTVDLKTEKKKKPKL